MLMEHLLDLSSYSSTVRAAQRLASLLKRLRPDLGSQIQELQGRVTQSHAKLNELSQLGEDAQCGCEREGREPPSNPARDEEVAFALTGLEAAYQSLRDLKHSSKPAS